MLKTFHITSKNILFGKDINSFSEDKINTNEFTDFYLCPGFLIKTISHTKILYQLFINILKHFSYFLKVFCKHVL